jgi:hypothetical protein
MRLVWLCLLLIYNFTVCRTTSTDDTNTTICYSDNADIAYNWVELIVPDWNYRQKIPMYIIQRYLNEFKDIGPMHREKSFPSKLSVDFHKLGCRNFPLNRFMAVLRIYYAISSEEIQQIQISSFGSSYFTDTTFTESRYIHVLSIANEKMVLNLVIQRISNFLEEVDDDNKSLQEYFQALNDSVNIALLSISRLNEVYRCEDDITSLVFQSIMNDTESDFHHLLLTSDLISDLLLSYIESNLTPFLKLRCDTITASSNNSFSIVDSKLISYGDHFCNLSVVQFEDHSSSIQIDDITLFTRKRYMYW